MDRQRRRTLGHRRPSRERKVNGSRGQAFCSYSDFTLLTRQKMLLGYMRIAPPPSGGIYPFLYEQDPSKNPFDRISLVSFTARKRAGGGEFYDFTSRYGAVRDEERLTLREAFFSEINDEAGRKMLNYLSERLDLTKLLDLPFIVLSNGQTRRARIAKALLSNPSLLLLDEPLSE